MNRAILHLRPENFYVAAERIRNPELKGKALLIIDQEGGSVHSASAECEVFGVYPGMELTAARKAAPHAIVVPADGAWYRQQSEQFAGLLSDLVPILEKTSIDRFNADISAIGDYPASWKWAKELRQRVIRETGLPVSIGLSASKFVSRLAAAHAGPEKYIAPGAERGFLAPFPIQELSFPHEGMRDLLLKKGILRIGQLAGMSPGHVQRLLGKKGLSAWQEANGICHQGLAPYRDPGSVSTEVTFPRDCHSVPRLLSILSSMTDKLCFSLRKNGMAASLVSVKLGYPDLTVAVHKARVPSMNLEKKLASKAHDLFHTLYDRTRRVRMIGLRLGDLELRNQQMQLFANTTGLFPGHFSNRQTNRTVGLQNV
ncbi:MAG: hypothetical protein FWJ85_03050 [Solitalea sp.]